MKTIIEIRITILLEKIINSKLFLHLCLEMSLGGKKLETGKTYTHTH